MTESFFISKLLNQVGEYSNFENFYIKLTDFYKPENKFYEISAPKCSELDWPNGIGVYVVRAREGMDVVYIGMTGKVQRMAPDSVKLEIKKNGFKNRSKRWHPYCFSEKGRYENHFEFGPNFGVNELKKQDEEVRYKYHLPISGLVIDCFSLDEQSAMAPTFLESLILQVYFTSNGTLPVANNIL
jgi:hypothetical protein